MAISTTLQLGQTSEIEVIVDEMQTALKMGSGRRLVLATPALVALMEKASQQIIDNHVSEGWESIGTSVNVVHDSMTPIGMTVKIKAELIDFDGKEAVFKINAYDDQGQIGSGNHRRRLAKTRTLLRLLNQK